ncbi:ribosome biogenesis protein [Candidatus Woesearchaeota archaeon CG10_big_fil_rev_8_21_14_0_10_45_16]|nr:MAG: ribosome biogenesis protein [Candidatus Woesearchaeota archaeon CG10_big_fil_rev_8_21_14_0_10_45_16]
MKHILKCSSCNSYTLHEKCPQCGSKALEPKPPKFSPEDKYGSYRREIKKKELEEKGLY